MSVQQTGAGPEPAALVVIDMQRQFLSPGAPFLVEAAGALVDRLGRAVDRARRNGVPVIWVRQRVRDAIGPGRTSRRYGREDIHSGWLSAIDDRLDPGDDIVVEKVRQSAFYATDLESILRNLDIDTVVLSGVTTNVCVLATAIDAGARDFGVVVASDLTASLPVRRGDEVLLTAEEVQRAAEAFVIHAVGEVRTTSEIPWLAS
jgi:ureidoacrylate peracid hydrolase